MEAFLLKMSNVEDPVVQDKVLMNDVRDLSYDMEGAIDDIMQSVVDKDKMADSFIDRIKGSLGELGKMKVPCRVQRSMV